MTTLQETVVGGVIVLCIGYIGKQIDNHYIQKKIESTPDIWSTVWYYTYMFLMCITPATIIIYHYLYKPLDKFFVLIIAFCIGVIVFILLNAIHTRQVIKARKEAIKHTNDIVLLAIRKFGESFKAGPPKEKDENNQANRN
jgi:xanthine/uracil permease